jgi:hypothetical protein
MGFDGKQLQEATKSLYGFGGKRIEPPDSISLPISFESLQNARGLLNTFKAALHLAYLCLKVPALLGEISVHDSQNNARNI